MEIQKKEGKIERVDKKQVKEASEKIKKAKAEMAKIIVGQEKIIDGLLRALICNGHVLVEGIPGIAKTLIVKTLATVSGTDIQRIQFTVDLLPTDIIGLTIYKEKGGFEVMKGPIFTNFLIADEINRAPPKTQSALLEAMQERQVTLGRQRFVLPIPFLVMATQNPIEQSGVYTLPEAQKDRFLFKLIINYPEKEEEKTIMKRNIDLKSFEEFGLKRIISPKEIISMQHLVKEIYLSKEIENYILSIVDATRERGEYSKYISYGGSPRSSIGLFIASKAQALMKGRSFVTPEDVKTVAFDVLRHRIILNYEAEAENLTTDKIITGILNKIPVP